MTISILPVDMQNEFATEGGTHYRPRACVPFIKDTFLPFVRERGSIAEIISDYRVAEPGSGTPACVPGQWGYQSVIPTEVKLPNVWVKAEPSPVWIREGAGDAEQTPGAPYPAPDTFNAWLRTAIGPPTPEHTVILIGLVLEICVLSTLQELHYRGYYVQVLFEGVDTYSGDVEQKRLLFKTLFPFWGEGIYWHDMVTASNFSSR